VSDDEEPVVVPMRLAMRIRLALDHVPENVAAEAAGGTTVYGDLATELVACENYPTWKEPWGE
jgi:hypothetical protein